MDGKRIGTRVPTPEFGRGSEAGKPGATRDGTSPDGREVRWPPPDAKSTLRRSSDPGPRTLAGALSLSERRTSLAEPASGSSLSSSSAPASFACAAPQQHRPDGKQGAAGEPPRLAAVAYRYLAAPELIGQGELLLQQKRGESMGDGDDERTRLATFLIAAAQLRHQHGVQTGSSAAHSSVSHAQSAPQWLESLLRLEGGLSQRLVESGPTPCFPFEQQLAPVFDLPLAQRDEHNANEVRGFVLGLQLGGTDISVTRRDVFLDNYFRSSVLPPAATLRGFLLATQPHMDPRSPFGAELLRRTLHRADLAAQPASQALSFTILNSMHTFVRAYGGREQIGVDALRWVLQEVGAHVDAPVGAPRTDQHHLPLLGGSGAQLSLFTGIVWALKKLPDDLVDDRYLPVLTQHLGRVRSAIDDDVFMDMLMQLSVRTNAVQHPQLRALWRNEWLRISGPQTEHRGGAATAWRQAVDQLLHRSTEPTFGHYQPEPWAALWLELQQLPFHPASPDRSGQALLQAAPLVRDAKSVGQSQGTGRWVPDMDDFLSQAARIDRAQEWDIGVSWASEQLALRLGGADMPQSYRDAFIEAFVNAVGAGAPVQDVERNHRQLGGFAKPFLGVPNDPFIHALFARMLRRPEPADGEQRWPVVERLGAQLRRTWFEMVRANAPDSHRLLADVRAPVLRSENLEEGDARAWMTAPERLALQAQLECAELALDGRLHTASERGAALIARLAGEPQLPAEWVIDRSNEVLGVDFPPAALALLGQARNLNPAQLRGVLHHLDRLARATGTDWARRDSQQAYLERAITQEPLDGLTTPKRSVLAFCYAELDRLGFGSRVADRLKAVAADESASERTLDHAHAVDVGFRMNKNLLSVLTAERPQHFQQKMAVLDAVCQLPGVLTGMSNTYLARLWIALPSREEAFDVADAFFRHGALDFHPGALRMVRIRAADCLDRMDRESAAAGPLARDQKIDHTTAWQVTEGPLPVRARIISRVQGIYTSWLDAQQRALPAAQSPEQARQELQSFVQEELNALAWTPRALRPGLEPLLARRMNLLRTRQAPTSS